MTLLEVRDLQVDYGSPREPVVAAARVDLTAARSGVAAGVCESG